MEIRPATRDDLDGLLALPDATEVGSVSARQLREELAAGRMRLPWSWLVTDDDATIVGRALWWGRVDSVTPLTLDCLHLLDRIPDRTRVATDLLERAHRSFTAAAAAGHGGAARVPAYQLSLPPRWREDQAVVDAVAWRVQAAGAAGLTEQVERLQYEWSPADGLPATSGRLSFRPGTEQEFLAIFEQVTAGSLDVATQRSLAVMDPQVQAREDYDFYLGCPGERDWWRIATTTDGTPVGFIVPSATPYARNVGYLGVLPAHRGRGFVHDLLAEITRFHATQSAERVTATTDVTNTPMAAAFDRAGYRMTETRLVLEAPADQG